MKQLEEKPPKNTRRIYAWADLPADVLRRSKTALEKELCQVKANGSTSSAAAVPPRSSRVEEELRQDLEDAIATKEASEQRLTKQIESLRKLKDSAKHEFEETLRERDEEIA